MNESTRIEALWDRYLNHPMTESEMYELLKLLARERKIKMSLETIKGVMPLDFNQIDTDVYLAKTPFFDYELYKNKNGLWQASILFDSKAKQIGKSIYKCGAEAENKCMEDFKARLEQLSE